MKGSNSSLRSTRLGDRVREWMALARLSAADRGPHDFADLRASFAQHDAYALQYLGRPLRECRVIEIGYGARPNRLLWFYGQGVDITGIDLDRPILQGTGAEFLHVYRTNGWERALKTVGRWFLNERHLRRELLAQLSAERGHAVSLPIERLAVGDAADPAFWQEHPGADYIFSEDVFEHIPREPLAKLVAALAAAMAPGGIAVIKPMVYTGICGGHQLDWYPHTFDQPIARRTAPWEHLRENRHPANTYLNGLSRAEYRALFPGSFDILEETVAVPRQGEQFMTAEIRRELSAYPDEELFSNAVVFVLRPKTLQSAGRPASA